jgi:hypothetical protein
MPRARVKRFPSQFLLIVVLAGCGGGANMTTPPSNPVFSSVPEMVASEGTLYRYQLVATSPNNSPVTFALTTGPAGATLSGNTVSWTPTHAESRTANSFSVTASNASGGSASQAWSVTPSGTIQLTAVTTYWTPTGTVDLPRVWLAGLPYPAALVPQSDGSLTRLQGAANADGTFSIPEVPGGFYWLQLSPTGTYWTSSSDFDAGTDVVGSPQKQTTQSSTTFNVSLSGLDPIQTQDVFPVQSNGRGFFLGFSLGGVPGATTLNTSQTLRSNIDFSQINTVFFSQLEPVDSGGFSGLALGPELTESNLSITNGAVNNISGTLTASPRTSIPLNIKGTAWANNYLNAAIRD